MKISDVCPLCKKINKKSWVIAKIGDKQMKICKPCWEDRDPPGIDTSRFEKTQKRMEEERKKNNAAVLRSYRIKP
jgi:hypothetical protein